MKVIDNNTCYTYYLKDDYLTGNLWKKVKDRRATLASVKKYLINQVDPAYDTYKKYLFIRGVMAAPDKEYLAELVDRACKKASKLNCKY